ncbi:MAG: hypothetical protein M5U18_02450 [Dehalococcoidia bacterium]|nr:hypothetical protein [Dehalococcoidia bacterium]
MPSAGVLTATGATIKSGAGNARAELTAVNGVSVYDSGGTVRGRLSTDGSGFLGSTNGLSTGAAVRWTSAGAATINADAITTGTINAGTITVSNLNATNLTTGTLGNGGSGIGLGGTNGLSISGNLTLASGGKIIDADGSYWDQNGIVLKSGGVFGDSIKWQVSGVDKGSIYASVNDVVLNFPSGRKHLRGVLRCGHRVRRRQPSGGHRLYLGNGETLSRLRDQRTAIHVLHRGRWGRRHHHQWHRHRRDAGHLQRQHHQPHCAWHGRFRHQLVRVHDGEHPRQVRRVFHHPTRGTAYRVPFYANA